MPARKIRLPGDRHGRLVLVEEVAPDRWGGRQFLFKCDCGKTVTARWGITISCGCAQKDFVVSKLNTAKRLRYGEACLNFVYARYKAGAKYRRHDFCLTKEEFRSLSAKLCAYCGSPPSRTETKYGDAYGQFVYNGLDRVDNTKGYTLDNVVPCCRTCNIAKRTMTKNQFLRWVQTVYEYSIKSI